MPCKDEVAKAQEKVRRRIEADKVNGSAKSKKMCVLFGAEDFGCGLGRKSLMYCGVSS